MSEFLDCVELETGEQVDASIIWMHGLGADGHDFAPIVPELRPAQKPGWRFVFPHAPVRPVTINNGMSMRAWFDILALDRHARQDEAGIRESAAHIEALVKRERQRGIASQRIVLAGFSQGGAMALHTALRHAEPFAGIVGLSCYLPLQPQFDAEAQTVNKDTPVFLAHGLLDPMLPAFLGEEARDFLLQRDYSVSWHGYPMMHAVCPEEIHDLSVWLAARLA